MLYNMGMDLMYSFFFAAGVATFVYVKLGKHIGYGNGQTVWVMVGVVFVVMLAFFYSVTRYFVHLH